MNRLLEAELVRIGWDAIYERHVRGLAPPNVRGERAAFSPLPDVRETRPSFSVNTLTGLWYCFSSHRGGNYVMFRALLDAREFDADGRAIPDYAQAERDLLQEFNVEAPISEDWIRHCRDALWGDLALRARAESFKSWDWRVLYWLNVGYDHEWQRFTLPCYDGLERLVNARAYRPGGEPKTLWRVPNLTGNFVFPREARREDTVILTMGEGDALSLRSHDFPGVSGTQGDGAPVPEGRWYRNKTVYVFGDADPSGEEAAQVAADLIVREARRTLVCALPRWPGRPANADVSDYLLYLTQREFTIEQRQRAVAEVLRDARPVAHPHAVFDAPAVPVSFARAASGEQLGRRIEFTAQLTARSERRYLLPTRYEVTCPAEGHDYCRRCPMRVDFHGRATLTWDPRAEDNLALVQASAEEAARVIKRRHGIPVHCPDPVVAPLLALDIEPAFFNAPFAVGAEDPSVTPERQRREALLLLQPGAQALEEGLEYRLSGFVYPAPRTQQAILYLDQHQAVTSHLDDVELTPALVAQLRATFAPASGEDVYSALVARAEQLARATRVVGRLDLHLAYRCVWHSVLEFPFLGRPMTRGWIECLVVGDTRCGKSATFLRLAELYGVGRLIDCRAQTQAGLLGAVVTSQNTGERYVVPGAFPLNDNRVLCLDEFHARSGRGAGLLEALASTRSEGVVRITKAASAAFKSRVRSIWLANPGYGKLLSDLGISGADVVGRIIPQPEDVARFDIGLTVAQHEVSEALLNSAAVTDSTSNSGTIPAHLHRALLAWTWSRRSNQVAWDTGAERAVLDLSSRMCRQYSARLPLVEPADQRSRVAKLAVSVAAQSFSASDDGEQLTVTAAHVWAAEQLFHLWYDKPSMGYDALSARAARDRDLADPDAVQRLFDVSLAPHGRRVARTLLDLESFSERTWATIAPLINDFPRQALLVLTTAGALRLVERGRRDAYELTPAFAAWLRAYLE